ncbi:DUF4244 domain-containing protein [Nocardioides massiliensis]|uniref:DUF4244 domain-containing protein n=1 Tax=Nocardioides massiliensis TaxID=1325935 RepID=A0ABT9NKJ5_9ACTN|nr:DUF4244 domain-containing protein [Nocardioides massiliensis]MDP9820941.1 hypothetical protein [Nocardioides massiliensis]
MTHAPVARNRRLGTGILAAHAGRTARARSERGSATAEYAVATAGAVGFAGVLIKFLTSEGGQALLKMIFDLVMGLIKSFF